MLSHDQQYTIIKETRIENQIGNRIRAGNWFKSKTTNQDQIRLVLPKQLIAMQRWEGGSYGTTKWVLYIFRTGDKLRSKNIIPEVFPKVDLLFFCFGATRVNRTLKIIDHLGAEFKNLSNEYWLHQNARIQTGMPLILPYELQKI
jgi:hypothetical protein